MKYFAYQNAPSGAVWSLFHELGSVSAEQRERVFSNSDYAHTLEIVSAAMNGKIPTDPESISNFNLWGYEYACTKTDQDGRRKETKKTLNIVEFSTSSDDSLEVGYGDISARELGSEEALFDEIVDSVDFEENLRMLFNIRSRYISEQGVDVVSVLYGALKGIPDALSEIKKLLNDSVLRDLYTHLCEESKDGALLRRLEMAV